MPERYLCIYCDQVITDAEEFVITNKADEPDPSHYRASHVHCYTIYQAQQAPQQPQAEAGAKAPISCPTCGQTFRADEMQAHLRACQAGE